MVLVFMKIHNFLGQVGGLLFKNGRKLQKNHEFVPVQKYVV